MTKGKSAKDAAVHCFNCGVRLTSFEAYVPGKGEACLKCFQEFAKEEKPKPRI